MAGNTHLGCVCVCVCICARTYGVRVEREVPNLGGIYLHPYLLPGCALRVGCCIVVALQGARGHRPSIRTRSPIALTHRPNRNHPILLGVVLCGCVLVSCWLSRAKGEDDALHRFFASQPEPRSSYPRPRPLETEPVRPCPSFGVSSQVRGSNLPAACRATVRPVIYPVSGSNRSPFRAF